MMLWTQIGWGLAILLAVLATVAEVRTTKRIPNGLVYPFIVAGFALAIGSLVYWSREGVVGFAIAANCLGVSMNVVVGVIGPFLAWRYGIAGGGVVKLAFALSLLLPMEGAVGMLVVSIVMAVVWRLKTRAADAPSIDEQPTTVYMTPYFLVVTVVTVVARGMLLNYLD